VIDRKALLEELQPLVTRLVDDLRAQAGAKPAIAERLAAQHREAVEAGRTAMALEDWREDDLTQGAVAWVLACVFVRFLEDNGLIADPLLSGPGARRDAALGRRAVYFERHCTRRLPRYSRRATRASTGCASASMAPPLSATSGCA
jgi:hypothetical protein